MPNKVSVISHEYIEPNTDQGGRRGRDEDATPARATAWRQRIGRRRHEDWSRRFALLRRPRKLFAHVLGRRPLDWEILRQQKGRLTPCRFSLQPDDAGPSSAQWLPLYSSASPESVDDPGSRLVR